MFFIRNGRSAYHILEDFEEGAAPDPCGARLDKVERYLLRQGRPARNVVNEKPTDAPLCKHCEKSGASDF